MLDSCARCAAVLAPSAARALAGVLTRLAALALLAATLPGAASQQSHVARKIAAENAGFTVQIADGAKALQRAELDSARLRKSKEDLEERMRRIERGAQAHVLGREFAQTVIEQLRLLPRPEQFAAAREARARLLAATSDANLRSERLLDELGDLDAALATRLAGAQPPIPDAQRDEVEAAMRALLDEQRGLLAQLNEQQQQLLNALREAGDAEGSLERQSHAAHVELTRLLFWIPSPPGTQTITELVPSLAWMVAPANWRTAGVALLDEAARKPFWPGLALLVAAGLYAGRRRLRGGLVALAPAELTYERYRIGHALAGLALTLALALPGPILTWTAGALLRSAPDTQPFAQALGDAFTGVARLLLALSAFAWLFDRRGVAVGHFGWDAAWVTYAGRALHRFTVLFVPMIFIAALNGVNRAPFANRESLGRLAFNLAMVALAVFLAYLFRRKSPLLQRLRARAPRGWPVQLHVVWFAALVGLPLGIGVLAAAGYIVAAGYFFGRLLESLFLVLGAVVLYGLIALWVQLQRMHLIRRRRDAETAPQAGGRGEAEREIAPVSPRLDVAAIGEQTRSLLDLFTTLLLLAGMWWVWREAVPALAVIGDYALWTYTDTVDGKSVEHPVTVGGLFLAMVVGAVTAVAVRNVGALLDIVLLQRLEMQADATYAIKVTARYALAAVGITVAANMLGIGWSDVQWLVAALGVGLGFGLQEIFANFVSGLIVLAERPIRIGDVVTVGDVSGTVSHIRARATSVIDFDNKEVIIPNKSFITDRVVNWTLSNQTTRLLLKMSVSHDSDVALAQRVMLEAVQRNPDVLTDPPPSVFFVGFGSKGLDVEIRAFVGSLDKRLKVQHEINLAVNQALREKGIEIL